MAATWVVCAQCGKVQETLPDQQIPAGWREAFGELRCPKCDDANEDDATGDVLDEEIVYPSTSDTVDVDIDDVDDTGFCSVCKGPCQGH